MRHFRLLLPILLSLPAAEARGRPTLPPHHLATLERGQVLEFSNKVPGTNVMQGKAIGVIEDTPEAVAHVLLDLARYKSYLPRVTDSRIVKRRGPHTFAVVETDLPWPVKDCWVYLKYTRYDKPGRVVEVRWWMVNGTMKNYTGAALIEPWSNDAKKSVLSFKLLAEPQTAAPDSMISNGVKQIARVIVQKTRLRLKALRKFGKMPAGF